MIRALALASALAGCYRPSPPSGAPCDELAPCPTGQACVNGTCGGSLPIDAPIIADALDMMIDAPDADPNCMLVDVCMDDMVVGCDPPVACAWGCITTGGAHCGRLDPSNAISWTLVPANPATLTITNAGDPWTLDTDTGVLANAGGAVALPAGTASVVSGAHRVLAAGAIVVEANANLAVVGSRPLVLLAVDQVTIGTNAVVDLDAGCRGSGYDPTCAGAGGGRGASSGMAATGCGPGQDGAADLFAGREAGGGGGGMATAGGNGGGVDPGEGIAGIMCGAATNVPLLGGSGGGAGGVVVMDPIVGGRGGGGGGALQISAGNTITIAGVISANGAGGETGYAVSTTGGGGGGGGAGGGILLEAGRVDVTGTLAANGGGGGGHALAADGGHGTTGQRSSTCAPGGAAGTAWLGGNGGCLATPPTSTLGSVNSDRGGGGGAAGWITIARATGITSGVVSPAPAVGTPDFD